MSTKKVTISLTPEQHKNVDVKNKATMLLNQYKTAGGITIKNELENFLNEHGY